MKFDHYVFLLAVCLFGSLAGCDVNKGKTARTTAEAESRPRSTRKARKGETPPDLVPDVEIPPHLIPKAEIPPELVVDGEAHPREAEILRRLRPDAEIRSPEAEVTAYSTSEADVPPYLVSDTEDPLYLFSRGGKVGFTDRHGRVRIRPRFDAASLFSEGLAPVKMGATRRSEVV